MSFLLSLTVIYIILATLAVISFTRKQKAVGVSLVVIMGAGAAVLWYLWTHSPM